MFLENIKCVAACLIVISTYGTVDGKVNVIDFSGVVNCTDIDGMFALIHKCSSLYDVPLALPSPELLTNTTIPRSTIVNKILNLQDPNLMAKMCSNIDNVVKVSLCAASVSKTCIPDIPLKVMMFPTEDQIRKQTEFSCSNYHRYNHSCAKSNLPQILECSSINDVMKLQYGDNVTVWLEKLLCTTFTLSNICATKYLQSCGDITLQLYQASKPDFSVCSSETVYTGGVGGPTVECRRSMSVKQAYLKCLIGNNVIMDLPNTTSSDISSYILNSMSLVGNHHTCSNLQSHQNAINCTLSIQRQCTDNIMKDTVPDPHTVMQGLADLCSDIHDFQTACVMKIPTSACSGKRRRRRSFTQQLILRHLCDDTHFSHQCLVDSVKRCGQKTQSLYKQLLISQQPAMCLRHTHGASALIG